MSKRENHTRRPKKRVTLHLGLLLFIVVILGLGYFVRQNSEDESTSVLDTTQVQKSEATIAPSNLTVHFIDVGQADSILIESDGKFMLVDAGNSADKDIVINYLKNQGVEELNYVVATHPHEDHIGAMDEVVEDFSIGKVFAPYVEHTSKTYYNLLEAIILSELKMKQPEIGSEVTLGGSTITFLAPNVDYGDDLNNWSVGLKVTNGVHTFVMCGDAEELAESDIIATGIDLKADVLKLGHHGSSTSSSDAFLKAVEPKYAVISSGVDNSYGHPHVETLQKIDKLGIQLFRTDQQGNIIATSDGKELTWNVEACN